MFGFPSTPSTNLNSMLAGSKDGPLLRLNAYNPAHWERAKSRLEKAISRDYVPMVVMFHSDGKKGAEQRLLPIETRKLYLQSPLEDFVDLQIGRKFEEGGYYTGTITRVQLVPSGTNDLLAPLITVKYQDSFEEQLCKAQVSPPPSPWLSLLALSPPSQGPGLHGDPPARPPD